VVLSGGGGDELFGGYPWRYYRGLGSSGADDYFRKYYQFWQRLVPDEDKKELYHSHIAKRLNGHSTFDIFREVFANYPGPFASNEDYINASLYFELKTFLHGLLVVEDKLSMAHSLESRVPFLDDDLVDYAVRIPARFKVRNLQQPVRMDENNPAKRQLNDLQTNDGKAVLRSAMTRIIPQQIIDRSKQGFSAPDASWFRGESIDYINRLLRNPRAKLYDFISPAYVHKVLDQHCGGKENKRLLIWSFLSFEWWLRQYFA
jgi:asparagine synthase (glutamine-hydrolysing)